MVKKEILTHIDTVHVSNLQTSEDLRTETILSYRIHGEQRGQVLREGPPSTILVILDERVTKDHGRRAITGIKGDFA